MSRRVRCSYGKRAGFVDAKIGVLIDSNKLFPVFLMILKKNEAIFIFLRFSMNVF